MPLMQKLVILCRRKQCRHSGRKADKEMPELQNFILTEPNPFEIYCGRDTGIHQQYQKDRAYYWEYWKI